MKSGSRAPFGAVLVRALQVVAIGVLTAAAAGIACEPDKVVSTDPVGFQLLLSTDPAPGLVPGGSAQLDVTITRMNGFAGAVTLHWTDPTNGGVTAADVTVPAGETIAHITFSDPNGTAPHGNHFIKVFGSGVGVQSVELDLVVIIAAAGTITVNVTGDYFYAVAGVSVTTTVQITRTQYTQPVTIAVTPPAGSGLTATILSQPGLGSTADVRFTLAGNAPTTGQCPTQCDAIDIKASGPGTTDAHFAVHLEVTTNSYTLNATAPTAPVTAGTGTNCAPTCAKVWQRWDRLTNTHDVVVTGTGPAGRDITIETQTIGEDFGSYFDLHITVGASVPAGTYLITLHGNTEGQFEKTATFSLVVAAPAQYSLSVATAPLNVTAGSLKTDNVTINRPGFAGAVTVSAIADTSEITVTANPATGTTGGQVVLTVTASQGVSAGTHNVALRGVAAAQGDVLSTFAVVVDLPAGGVPTTLIVVPATATVPLNGIQRYTAYLVDAQGNRTLPAAGWEISILSASSAVAQDQATPAYDVTQRWQTRPIKGVGVGTTQVHVAYDRISDGFTSITVLVPFTVTP